ncbi:uncharacterized protein A4U43_C08F26440 [Asparagus officinalis]|nr:uncharacterized protein A4U43_C08F26440 [Asparagus officinalis]
MKITSILILRCPDSSSSSDPVVVASATDVRHFWFFQRNATREFILFAAHTVAKRTQPGQRQSVQHEGFGDFDGFFANSSKECLSHLNGMKIGIDLETNKNQLLDSWKSTSDPGVGKYSVAMDPDKSTQLFLWEGTQPRWRSGRWNGQIFTGIIYKVPFYIDGFQSIGFGIRTLKFWSASLGTKSEKSCAIGYNRCGKNAICADEEIPICKCLQGFMPKSTKEWRNSNWSGGCIRKTPLQCEGKDNSTGSLEERDRFLKLERVKAEAKRNKDKLRVKEARSKV